MKDTLLKCSQSGQIPRHIYFLVSSVQDRSSYPCISGGQLHSCALMTDMFPADYNVSVSFLTLLSIVIAERGRVKLMLCVVGACN